MINIIIFVLGIIFIVISFIMATKNEINKDDLYNEILERQKQIELYSNTIEDVIENIEKIFNSKNKPTSNHEKGSNDLYKSNGTIGSDDIIPMKEGGDEEIFYLHKNGMSINEIAKKLNRGKREVEFILRMKDDKGD